MHLSIIYHLVPRISIRDSGSNRNKQDISKMMNCSITRTRGLDLLKLLDKNFH